MRKIDADKFAETLIQISDASWFREDWKEAWKLIAEQLLTGPDKEKYSPTLPEEDNIEECAKAIQEYCTSHCADEKSCPFFRGYKQGSDTQLLLVQCELNKGHCSPANWCLNCKEEQ